MDYIKFKEEDFVSDDYFRKWTNGLLPEEDVFWENWLFQNPEKKDLVRRAQFIVRALEFDDMEISEQRISESVKKIDALTREPYGKMSFLDRNRLKMAVAAIVIIGVGLGLAVYLNRAGYQDEGILADVRGIMIEKINNSAYPLKVSLSDGSEITLRPHSKLSYPETFAADRREVFLTGEGFFDITKNPDKPFFVYANELVTKVLGTSFLIRAYEQDKDVTVRVMTGKVSVAPRKVNQERVASAQQEGAVLTPNQMAIYTRNNEKLIKTLVDNPVMVAMPDQKQPDFHFNNVPVPEVLRILEKSYGVTIVYDEELLSGCTINAPLANETLYEKLNLICKVIRASYEVIDAQIIVTSKGCK